MGVCLSHGGDFPANGKFIAPSKESTQLLVEIGGGNSIREMTTRFYEKAFDDQIVDKFITSHEDPHAERLGNFIVQCMGGEGRVWSDSRPRAARQIAHFKAWKSPKREPEKFGERFKLADCRVWMRLMFWSAREVGVAGHEEFFAWFVQFIAFFIGIYERTAPRYALDDSKWSADPANTKQYLADDRLMKDIVKK